MKKFSFCLLSLVSSFICADSKNAEENKTCLKAFMSLVGYYSSANTIQEMSKEIKSTLTENSIEVMKNNSTEQDEDESHQKLGKLQGIEKSKKTVSTIATENYQAMKDKHSQAVKQVENCIKNGNLPFVNLEMVQSLKLSQ